MLVGDEISTDTNDYYEQYKQNDYMLHLTPTDQVNNRNAGSDAQHVLQNLNYLHGAPSVQVQEVPPDYQSNSEQRNERGADISGAQSDKRGDISTTKQHQAEYYDGPRDQDNK